MNPFPSLNISNGMTNRKTILDHIFTSFNIGKRYFMSTVITELMLNLEKVDEGFSRDNGARGTYYHRQFSELSVSLFSFMEALLAGALS